MKLEAAVSFAILAVVFATLVYGIGCIPQEAKEAVADSAYAAEHLACVDKYPTKAQIDACRDGVRLHWHIAETVTDGGRHDHD